MPRFVLPCVLLKIPWRHYLLWFAIAVWLAAGVSGLHTAAEREIYAQTRALAQLTVRLTPSATSSETTLTTTENVPRQRPGVAVCALPFYLAGRVIGALIDDDPAQPTGLTAQITSLATVGATAAALVMLGLCGYGLGLRTRSAFVLCVLLAVASPFWPYGTRLAAPAFGLLAITLMLYALLRIAQRDPRVAPRFWLGAGLGLSLLLSDEQLVVLPLFMLWALAYVRRVFGRPGYALAFLLPFSSFALLFVWYNQVAWGGWLNATDGSPLWAHLLRNYWQHAAVSDSTWRYLLNGAKFWLFSDGPMPVAMAMARELPASLRDVVFFGAVVWCPLLIVGALGIWALLSDNDAGGPMRLLLVAFFIALAMRALARPFVPPSGYDAGDTLPFWTAWLMGLGFFIEYHLLSLRVGIIRAVLLVGFLLAAAMSLANAAYDVACNRAPTPVETTPPAAAKTIRHSPLGTVLPPGKREAAFLPLEYMTGWAATSPSTLAARLWPGVRRLPLFLPILLVCGAAPFAAAWIFHWRLRRGGGPVEAEEEEIDPAAPPPLPQRRASDRPAEKREAEKEEKKKNEPPPKATPPDDEDGPEDAKG